MWGPLSTRWLILGSFHPDKPKDHPNGTRHLPICTAGRIIVPVAAQLERKQPACPKTARNHVLLLSILFYPVRIYKQRTTKAIKSTKRSEQKHEARKSAVQEAQGTPNHQGTSQTGWQRTPVRNGEGQSPGSNTAPNRCLLGLVLHLLQRRSEPSLGSKVHHVAFEHFCINPIRSIT